MESVEKLIRAGADVNICDSNYFPLHMSMRRPDICHLLIRHGARIDAINRNGGTLLHQVVDPVSLEIVHMLLYYNADANVPDNCRFTPFMVALFYGNVAAQEALLEYVDDFNRIGIYPYTYTPTMTLALESKSPFIKDMIQRGTDVNYGDYDVDGKKICAFLDCLQNHVDPSTFKMVWEGLRFDADNMTDLLDFFDYIDSVPSFLEVIIESDNFEYAVEFFCNDTCYASFVNSFAAYRLDLEQLTALTCRLLQYGFRATSREIHMIFSHYGYCELFRILLYMDNDFTCHWHHGMVVSRLIFDVDYNLESDACEISYIPKKNVMRLLEYSICPRLIDALTVEYSDDEQMSTILSKLQRVPSLIELTRNAARKQIWHKLKFTNACQLYTTIDHLDMPTVYKNILTFRKKIYEVEQ
ncbi:uncharacterized protein LOC111693112 [Anoplophora glabripennis]|uniref:uncharacterized protein LOC111693112 n=1 Tax=Anoplophora glabripennis TaxID=217634 RepID=UPI000C7732D7|nr:uncharacterized protein LOC111693112 [Anoplophora glabripennis]